MQEPASTPPALSGSDPRALSYAWEWRLPAPPERVWPFVSDTQRINRAIGLPPWHFTEEPDPLGGSVRRGSFRYLGMAIAWDEHPYEWEAPRRMGVVRAYRSGPLRVLTSRVTLDPADGGTHLVHRLEVVPGPFPGRLVAAFEIGFKTRRAFHRVYRRIGEHAAGAGVDPYPAELPALVPGAEGVTAHARRALLNRGFAPPLVDRLVELLHRAPDRELLRLRPFALARALGEEPVTVLRLMLHAAREGLLEMTWDLVCPQCRGAKQRPSDLGRVVSEVHCGSCNIKFDADFDRSVEVTFRPAPGVRSIPDAEYCVGGPGNTRHVVAQRRVPPRSRVEMDLALAPGSYRLRGPRTAGVLSLAIAAPGAAEPLAVALDRHGIAPDQASRPSGILRVAVENTDDREQLAILEHTAWSEDVASAAFVTTLQEFRDLFSSQVVSPGTRIGIRSIAFLFTDLKSSTAMYEKVGDASAFALVRDHFHILFNSVSTEQGGVVKTIGDAVMASFANPANALRAAFHMQDLMAEFNDRTRPPYPIQLKIGVHAGPCIAVNLNDRLDYFGTTVNMAARIQNESVGDDIVVLATLLEHPSVEALLGELRYRAEPFETELKGLTGTFHLVRLLPERPSPLPAT